MNFKITLNIIQLLTLPLMLANSGCSDSKFQTAASIDESSLSETDLSLMSKRRRPASDLTTTTTLPDNNDVTTTTLHTEPVVTTTTLKEAPVVTTTTLKPPVVVTTTTVPPVVITTTTTTMPMPPPPPSGSPFPKVGDFPSIPSNFSVNSELVPAWGNGAIPPSAAPDNVGAFRFICNPSHVGYDDPIVYPGQPGKSHLHQFFGNTLTDANSTYNSLRTSGMSTCNSPLNRSAYWIPAMINGAKGQVVKPDFVSIYYKRHPVTSSLCTLRGKACVDLPRGLRYIFGYNMSNPIALSTGSAYFNCQGPTATPGHYPSIVEAAANCPIGNQIGYIISSPECWDGVNLDSADHRSHVAYAKYIGNSYSNCPATHPYILPTFTLGAWYTTDADLNRSGTWDGTMNSWHLSSDEMHNSKPGTTIHADWFGAWDDSVMKMWTDGCINKLLNCSGGDLGNGLQLKMFSGFSWTASPRIITPPPVPLANPMSGP